MTSEQVVSIRRPRTRVADEGVRPPAFHLFETGLGDEPGLLVVDGSRIHRLRTQAAELLQRAEASGSPSLREAAFAALGLSSEQIIETAPPSRMPVRAFSLAIAQKCNLGCTYCYAEGGNFGGAPATMSRDVASAAVERLLAGFEQVNAVGDLRHIAIAQNEAHHASPASTPPIGTVPEVTPLAKVMMSGCTP